MSFNKLLLIYFFILFSCEPDDLCLETYADTPKLIVKFFDSNSQENIEIDNLIVEDNDRNIILFSGSTDSLSVPLNYIRQQTSLNLTYSNNLLKLILLVNHYLKEDYKVNMHQGQLLKLLMH